MTAPSNARSFDLLRVLRLSWAGLVDLEGRWSPFHPDQPCPVGWLARGLLALGAQDDDEVAHELERQLLTQEDPLTGLFQLASDHITLKEGRPYLKDPLRFGPLSRHIDHDLLACARLSMEVPAPGPAPDPAVEALAWPSSPRAATGRFSEFDRRELAETHLHLTGALPGIFYWIAALSGGAGVVASLSRWCQDDPERWPWVVGRAASLRLSLASRLKLLFPALDDREEQRLEEALRESGVPRRRGVGHWLTPLLLRRLPRVGGAPHLMDLLDVQLSDSCLEWDPVHPPWGERWLLWSLLHDLRAPGAVEGDRAEALEYLRLRSSFLSMQLHQHGSRGLLRFQGVFNNRGMVWTPTPRGRSARALRSRRRAERINAHIDEVMVARVLSESWDDSAGRRGPPGAPSPHVPVRSLELGVGLSSGTALVRQLRAILSGVRVHVQRTGECQAKVGVVLRVLKTPTPERGLVGTSPGAETLRQLRALWALLETTPKLRPFVVGIDAHGPERDTSPRELAPAFLWMRDKSATQRRRLGEPPIHLGRTFHVGEDPRDLLTGIRHVWEVIHLMDLRHGDRIGHGLALAWDPALWYQRRRNLLHSTNGDQLLDLAWALGMLNDHDGGRAGELVLTVRRQFAALTGARSPEAAAALDQLAWRMLSHGPGAAPAPAERALLEGMPWSMRRKHAQLTAPPGWVELVAKLQDRVVHAAAERELVLEVNPTSNLLISGLRDYSDLPYSRLNAVGLPVGGVGRPDLRLSLNTDDPGLLQTSLLEEYRRAGLALMHGPNPPSYTQALDWLDRARQVGVDSTFVAWDAPRGREVEPLLAALLGPVRGRGWP